MDEIEASLNAGKEVITHTDSVSVPGWSGAGYVIIDPDTGAGAFKITGGSNGGILRDISEEVETVSTLLASGNKTLDKLGGVGQVINKVIKQIKKFLDNIKTIIEIIEECGPFAILGVVLYLLALYVTIKISFVISGIVVGGATLLCGKICGLAAALAIVPLLLEGVNAMLESVGDTIVDGPLCKAY
jgi:hypothetical protein